MLKGFAKYFSAELSEKVSKTGKVYHYYKCSSVKRHLGCDMKSVRRESIEKEVLEYVVQNYLTKENMEIIVQQIMEINKKESAGILLLKTIYLR